MDLITSLQNDKVKLARTLQQKARSRRKERKIVLEGTRLVTDALDRKLRAHYILYDPQYADAALITRLEATDVELLPANNQVIRHTSDTQHPQGIVGVFQLPMPPLPRKAKRVLILDKLSDPGNMGTLLRTAAAAGVEVVVLSPGCTDPYNPKVLRSGMGAHFRIPIVEASWEEIAGYCERLDVYLADGGGDTAYNQVDWTRHWALVIGSEAHGISQETEMLDATKIHIPMAARTESLNAGVAAGIILFEAARQNGFKAK